MVQRLIDCMLRVIGRLAVRAVELPIDAFPLPRRGRNATFLLELTAVGSSEAELEPARKAPFRQAIQEPTPNSLLPTQKQPNFLKPF